ncbi:hypothetical protein BJ165DRAFT_1117241 [Panaeolus papilionaceus]|nr:hypothetical protein BJ165DRAFT_1117241 [Panaeolus papilionaceus]
MNATSTLAKNSLISVIPREEQENRRDCGSTMAAEFDVSSHFTIEQYLQVRSDSRKHKGRTRMLAYLFVPLCLTQRDLPSHCVPPLVLRLNYNRHHHQHNSPCRSITTSSSSHCLPFSGLSSPVLLPPVALNLPTQRKRRNVGPLFGKNRMALYKESQGQNGSANPLLSSPPPTKSCYSISGETRLNGRSLPL